MTETMHYDDLVETIAHNIAENDLLEVTIEDSVNTILGVGYWDKLPLERRFQLRIDVVGREYILWVQINNR